MLESGPSWRESEGTWHVINVKSNFYGFVLLFRFLGISDLNPAMMKLLWVVMLLVGTVFADDDDKKDSVGTVVGIDLGTTYSW